MLVKEGNQWSEAVAKLRVGPHLACPEVAQLCHGQGTKLGWQREGRKQFGVVNRIESAAVQKAPLAKSTMAHSQGMARSTGTGPLGYG